MGERLIVVTHIERLQNSASGNPRWFLLAEEGTFITCRDAAVNYDVQNIRDDHADVLHTGVGFEAMVTVDANGEVYEVQPC